MKILIDTNIYFDFYRSNNEGLKIFKELLNHSDKIILTDQIIQEFERNREVVIKNLKKLFESESELKNFSSSYVSELQEFKELMSIQENYNKKRKEVSSKLSDIMKNRSKDPIDKFFTEFVNHSIRNNTVLYATSEIIERANKRKLRGNPPSSNQYSIGDEINWETVLANVRENIVIVGRDDTYKNNLTFLQQDYHKNTGFYIDDLMDSITKALRKIGIETSADLQREEDNLIEAIENDNHYWRNR